MNSKKISQLIIDKLHSVTENSKDPSTKCGAVIFDGYHFISEGCNNPRPEIFNFIEDKKLENRNFKINITEHAECCAIRKAKENNKTIYHSTTIYINSTPCLNCAVEIVKAGLKHVAIIDHNPNFENTSWGDLWCEALKYLLNNGVEVCYYDKFGKFMERIKISSAIFSWNK